MERGDCLQCHRWSLGRIADGQQSHHSTMDNPGWDHVQSYGQSAETHRSTMDNPRSDHVQY